MREKVFLLSAMPGGCVTPTGQSFFKNIYIFFQSRLHFLRNTISYLRNHFLLSFSLLVIMYITLISWYPN